MSEVPLYHETKKHPLGLQVGLVVAVSGKIPVLGRNGKFRVQGLWVRGLADGITKLGVRLRNSKCPHPLKE